MFINIPQFMAVKSSRVSSSLKCIMMLHFLALALGLASVTAAQYRLPDTVLPLAYKINLQIPPEVFAGTTDQYVGQVDIQIQPQLDTDKILLHAAHEFIDIITCAIDLEVVPPISISFDNETDIVTIRAGRNLTALTNHTLTINFNSRLSTDDMYGFYRSSYRENYGARYLATTQFQPVYARRAFPCFDEPAFKATFEININHPAFTKVLSNMPEEPRISNETGMAQTHFASTNRMPTYLVAFIVSDFTCSNGESIETNAVPYRICSTEETDSTRAFSIDVGPKLLRSLSNFTAYPYSQMGFPKMDQVAIPDFAAGAMENWGLVTYREQYLLWDPEESTTQDQQTIATIISHEFAHQWFGNLVTMEWWSETFLNEGFATYFEFFTTHEVFLEWELDKQFIVKALHSALALDSMSSAEPLQSAADSDVQVNSKFSQISYLKGGSILRMVEHIVGTDNFIEGIRHYLSTHAFKNTRPEDLWNSLDRQLLESDRLPYNTTLREIMENWITQPGYPLIEVNYVNTAITLRQKGRFLVGENDTTSRWYVPISFSTNLLDNFNNTAPQEWLSPLGIVEIPFISNPSGWILLNNQATGFYRVNYNGLWENLAIALRSTNFSGIPEVNRASLVDDAFQLARSFVLGYSRVFNVIEFLRNDISHHAWYPALSGFNFLLRRIGENSPLGEAVITHQVDLLTNIYRSVPWTNLDDSAHAYTLKQVEVLSAACRLGVQNCVDHALSRFGEFTISGIKPSKNLRSIVYCNALRYGDSDAHWNLLWDTYRVADLASEKVRILQALGCTRKEHLLERYLLFSIANDTGIKPQDAMTVFTSVYSGSQVGVDVALKFLLQYYADIEDRYQSMNALQKLISGLAERFTTQSQIEQLELFVSSGDFNEEFRVSAESSIQNAKANLQWIGQHWEELHQHYGLDPNSTSTVSTPTSTQTTGSTPSTVSTPATTPSGSGGVISVAAASIVSICCILLLTL